jgi:hypothetical protein
VSLELKSTSWVVELEWPQEVVGLLEAWSAGDDFVDKILNAVDANLSELSRNDAVVGEWKSSSVNLSISSLVDESSDGLSGWVSIGDEWLDNLKHVLGGFVELDEDSVVDLSESEQLQDLLWLWSKLVNTEHSQIRNTAKSKTQKPRSFRGSWASQ